VYKAKIGRDAITDIHVRRYSSKPYYFHPKSTALVARGFKAGLIYLQEAHRRFADRQTSASTSASARHSQHSNADAKCRFQVPHRNTAPYESHYRRLCISVPPSLTQAKKGKEKKVQHSEERLKTCWVPNPSTLRPGSRFVNRPRASWKAGTGPLALSCRNCPSPTREVGSPAGRDLSHRVSFRRP
jgi:hypothetical protein